MDPPLTNLSAHFAAELGFAMTQNLPTMLYVAPEAAAIQTARQLMDGAEIGMNWSIEPGLVKYYSPDEPKPSQFLESVNGRTLWYQEAYGGVYYTARKKKLILGSK